MNVGITCYPTYGGSGIVATELGLELANRGHDVHFITYSNPIRLDPGIQRIHYHEVEVSNYPLFQYPPYCLALASRMAEVAEAYSLDVLHVHYAIPHSISAMLAQQMLRPVRRLPFITTLHGTDITLVGMDRSYFPITKFSIEQSDGITSISDYLRQQTVDVFGVANEIRVIKNFVNCDQYRPDEQKTRAAVFCSRWRQTADPPFQFPPGQARAGLHPDSGRGPQACAGASVDGRRWAGKSPAERLARDLHVEHHVTFLGKQDHVERLLPLAHVLLMPSELESFGLAALEAMACGVPPVATRVGGVPELITDGVDGYLEAVGDVAAQAARVTALLTDEKLHKTMSRAARKTAGDRFCSDRIIPLYEKYYDEVVSGGGKAASAGSTLAV